MTMDMGTYKVEPLFAEPIFRAGIGHAITDEQVNFIKSLKMVPNQTNLISENLYIFDEPELGSIKHAVHELLSAYARDVMGITQDLYVTQSWALRNDPGTGMHGHSHSNSIISGSLYFDELPEPNSGMIFDRHRIYQQIQLNPEMDKRNIFNTHLNVIYPQSKEVMLFSSSLQHLVEANRSNVPRWSIAFNTFVRGELGDYRNVSRLKLG
ncbi:putative 2OG-Fe(II) oxygenase [Parvularcula marina]|uniref:putative 2OG-Fe(II) oxygenase n=1 Tax=Parvularcula marina TaxID=2292771 RepID=UPI003511B743